MTLRRWAWECEEKAYDSPTVELGRNVILSESDKTPDGVEDSVSWSLTSKRPAARTERMKQEADLSCPDRGLATRIQI